MEKGILKLTSKQLSYLSKAITVERFGREEVTNTSRNTLTAQEHDELNENIIGELSFIEQELSKAREEGKGRKLQGWECPKCGSVYSPLTFECPTCKNSGIKVRTSDRTSGYDNTSYLN